MRGRWIKPETWTSPTLARLRLEVVVLFIALWNYCDDEGRGLWDPTLIRATVFPLRTDVTDEDVADWLDDLRRERLIVRYRARPRANEDRVGANKAQDLLQIRSWSEHQSVNRPSGSRWPAPRKHRKDSRRTHGGLTERSRASSKEVQVERSSKALREAAGSTASRPAAPDAEIPIEIVLREQGAPALFADPDPEPEAEAPASSNGSGIRRFAERPNPWADLPPIEGES